MTSYLPEEQTDKKFIKKWSIFNNLFLCLIVHGIARSNILGTNF